MSEPRHYGLDGRRLYWRDSTGQNRYIEDMTDNYLVRICRMLNRTGMGSDREEEVDALWREVYLRNIEDWVFHVYRWETIVYWYCDRCDDKFTLHNEHWEAPTDAVCSCGWSSMSLRGKYYEWKGRVRVVYWQMFRDGEIFSCMGKKYYKPVQKTEVK